jgi:choline-sulfatase
MNLSRREFLSSTATVAASAVLAGSLPRRARAAQPAPLRDNRPNILMISTDQWHAEAFSSRGNTHLHTPHSDRLASQSVWFENSYAADPVCGPSRSCWITGRMPIEHGVVGNRARMIPTIPDSSRWFRQHGYEVAHFGKWDSPGRDPTRANDFYVGTFPAGQYIDQSIADITTSYLLSRSASKPFFLHASFMNPHDICQISCMRSNAGRLPVPASALPPLPPNFTSRPDEPQTLVTRIRNSPQRAASFNWDELDWRLFIWTYYRYCEMVDIAIGRVLDALEASGQKDNTLVLLTSDHGEGLGHHGMFTKAYMYEESARVPLAISWPGQLPTGQSNSPILTSGIDLFPTFCAAAGIPAPPNLPGQDILAQYRAGKGRDSLVTSATFNGRMARSGDLKLITYADDPVSQLFDLKADPLETRNLAREQPQDVTRLRNAISAFDATLTPAPPRPTPASPTTTPAPVPED